MLINFFIIEDYFLGLFYFEREFCRSYFDPGYQILDSNLHDGKTFKATNRGECILHLVFSTPSVSYTPVFPTPGVIYTYFSHLVFPTPKI